MTDIQNHYTPKSQQDAFTDTLLTEDYGFRVAKRLDDGSYVGIMRLAFTWGLCMGIGTITPFVKRFCYKDGVECLDQYMQIKSMEDEPTGWIARRPEPENFYSLEEIAKREAMLKKAKPVSRGYDGPGLY